jgi:CRP/FNR family transcriptional regulator, cyclic AMP receptor protein
METAKILKQADIFADISPAQLELIASVCQSRTFQQGELIFGENTGSDELYVIAEGQVEILVDPSLVSPSAAHPSELEPVAVLRRGQSFGEVALVDQGLRSAAARCVSPKGELVVIPRDRLILMCESDPVLGFRLMRNLAADLAVKLRNTDMRLRETLLPSDDKTPPSTSV